MPRNQALAELIAAGTLRPGTRLHHPARGYNPELEATVAAGGIRYNGKTYTTPSAAARAFTGRPVDGWRFWKLPNGQPVESLRPGSRSPD